MKWHLSRRDIFWFIAIVCVAEALFILGDQGVAAYAIGLLFPLAVLLAINAIVGASARSGKQDGGRE